MRVRLPVLIACLVVLVTIATSGRAPASPGVPAVGVWPVEGPVRMTRGFDPPVQRWNVGHRGVDLASTMGAPVRAAAAGTVRFAGTIAGRGVLVVDHGSVRTTYEPVIAEVEAGDRVATGQLIGRIGRGSHCASTCLHWGLRRGEEYLNPLLLLGGSSGKVRLVAAAERETAEKAAQARAAAEFATPGDPAGTSGLREGFLPPVTGGITSAFGMRFHPVLRVWKLHDGTDFGAACGSPIRAPAAGRVTAASYNAGYGNRLMIHHGVIEGRQVVTGFNHAMNYVVGVGQQVSRGQVIGYVGSTGFSTGCHLHLMVWLNGAVVNPMTVFS